MEKKNDKGAPVSYTHLDVYKRQVHGKGSFIAEANQEMLMEERRKELEHDLDKAVRKARAGGLTDQEICDLFQLIMEGE